MNRSTIANATAIDSANDRVVSEAEFLSSFHHPKLHYFLGTINASPTRLAVRTYEFDRDPKREPWKTPG